MPDLILKAHPSQSFAKKETRDNFVRYVTDLLSAGHGTFEPEQLNVGTTDLEWCVNSGNDWWVFFDRNDPTLVRIKNRYDVKQMLVSLGGLISYQWRMTVVTKELALPELETA
jgi:hypothetical protein